MTEAKTKPDAMKTEARPAIASKQIADKTVKKAKEGIGKAAAKTKQSMTQAASPNTDADESPQRYAESRIAESTEYAAERLESKINKPKLNHRRYVSSEETRASTAQKADEGDRLSANQDDACRKPAEQNPQAVQYRRNASAEKKNAGQEPSRSPAKEAKIQLRVSEPIRDTVEKAPHGESPQTLTMQSRQRQLAVDKYRNTVKERSESEHIRAFRAEEPASSNAIAHGTQDSDPNAPRTAEHPNTGSESLRFRADAHTPRGLRSGRTIQEAERGIGTAKKPARATVKTADQSIKTADRSIKTSQKTIKTSVKTTEKTAKATAKTAQKTAQATAKATAKAAKTAAQVVSNAVKRIVAAIKELIAAIIAGGWVSVMIIAVVAIISVILCLCFGVFSSNEASSESGRPMTAAIQEINGEFMDSIHARISRYKQQHKPDHVELVYEGDTGSDGGSVMNWTDVLGIYAVGTTTDSENPTDVLIVTDDKVNTLREIFNRMNSVSYDVEIEIEEVPAVDAHGQPIYDDDGEQVMDEEKTLTITITVAGMGYREAAQIYGFDDDQNEMLREMMRPEYYPLFAELTGDVIGDGGAYGFGMDINPDLPPSELGYRIVQAAKRYIGRSYASMDCSKMARTAYADVGLTSMNGLSSVRMAQKCQEMGCLFTDPAQLQAGDLIFFARFDPSRGKDYCGDVNRCGTGKCRRWLHIHHVAIYINEEFLIDSTGGDNSVQIRKHWGMDTSKWKWVCFGRPTT